MKRRSLFSRTLAALTGGLMARHTPAAAPTFKAPIVSSSLSALDKLFAQDAERITRAMAARRKEMSDLILHGKAFREADEFDVLPTGLGFNFRSASSPKPAA